MDTTDIPMGPLSRTGKGEHIEDAADLEWGDCESIKGGFTASVKDSILILREKRQRKRDGLLNLGEKGLIKALWLSKFRAYWARMRC